MDHIASYPLPFLVSFWTFLYVCHSQFSLNALYRFLQLKDPCFLAFAAGFRLKNVFAFSLLIYVVNVCTANVYISCHISFYKFLISGPDFDHS